MALFNPVFYNFVDAVNNELTRHYGVNQGRSASAKSGKTADPAAAAAAPETKTAPRQEREIDFIPAIDAFDTEHAFVVHASLPGATPNAISVDFEPKTNEVVISGEIRRPGVFADNIDSLRVSERRVGHFERRIRLGSNTKIVADNITAKLVNGVLEVSIPKVAEQPRKRITIETVANPADDWIDAGSSEHSSPEVVADHAPEAEKLD